MDQAVKFINKTEGRDKFCKAIQYASRFMAYQTKGSNDELHARFAGLMNGMKNARKLFRLFKTFNELHKILALMGKKDMNQKVVLALITRTAFAIYWIFDNLQVLSAVKFLKFDPKQMGKYGAMAWLAGLILSNIGSLMNLAEISKKEKGLSQKKGSKEVTEELEKCQKSRFAEILNLVKFNGDMITASTASQIAPKLGVNFNEGTIGLGGFTSAVVTMYQLY